MHASFPLTLPRIVLFINNNNAASTISGTSVEAGNRLVALVVLSRFEACGDYSLHFAVDAGWRHADD